jgi:predicted component of viral defense system (DUF524 family)
MMKSTQPYHTMQTHFVQNANSLIAENEHVRLQLSPVNPNVPFTNEGLTEETECNVLIRTRIDGEIQCHINGQPTIDLGFITDGNTQWGRINTGDRPGHIEFRIQKDGQTILSANLSIRPTKLDYENDYQTMRDDIQHIARALVFALPKHAQIHTQITNEQGSPLDFLQLIEQQCTRLIQTLRIILKRPHRQLASHTEIRPISLATGRDPDALTHIAHNTAHWTTPSKTHKKPFSIQNLTHLQETQHHPTTNTAVNRHLISNLHQLTRRLRTITQYPNTDSYRQMHKSLQQIRHHRTFHNIPPTQFNDAIPIHLDDRYQTAFTLMQNLNRALAPFEGGPFDLSYRDTPTLYEYWAWFTVIQTFQNLGFKPQVDKNLFHLTQRSITLSPTQGEPSAIHLQKDTTHIRCLYNLTYTTASGRSLTHDLRPDIVIEIQTPTTRTVHAFDAKYRREAHQAYWIPLREDIDKMHAYRDAVGQVMPDDFQRTLKSAIVLFPAPTHTAYQTHPFYKSLPHGIGGLPLLPGDTETLKTLSNHITQYILP